VGTTAEDLRGRLDAQRADLTHDVQAIGDRVTPGRVVERQRTQARRRLDDARDRIMGTRSQVMGSASSTAQSVTGRAEDMAGELRDRASDVPDQVRGQVQGAPVLAGVVAFGIGALMGAVIAPTRREQEFAEQHRDAIGGVAQTLQEGATAMLNEVKEDLQPELTESASKLGESAKEAASEVKSEVTDQATSLPGDVKDQASQA